jgi:hypothetical protein
MAIWKVDQENVSEETPAITLARGSAPENKNKNVLKFSFIFEF